MKTLYLRNVPDDVGEGLATLAARAGMSVSAYAVRELSQLARQAGNAAVLEDLPSFDVVAEDIVADLDAGRSIR